MKVLGSYSSFTFSSFHAVSRLQSAPRSTMVRNRAEQKRQGQAVREGECSSRLEHPLPSICVLTVGSATSRTLRILKRTIVSDIYRHESMPYDTLSQPQYPGNWYSRLCILRLSWNEEVGVEGGARGVTR